MAMASQGTAALLIFIISQTYGANILFYWSISGYSHRISVWPLVERLTAVGHNVTFFSPLPPKVPNANVTEVSSASGFKNIAATDFVSARIHSGPKGIEALWSNYLDFGFSNCEGILSDPAVIDWVKRSSYDLVVINSLLNDCGYGFAHKFKARYIIYEPTSPFGWSNDAYGYPDENYPLMDYHYPAEMTFMQRVWNGLRPLYWQFFRHWYTFPRIEAILKEKLNISDMPPISEMEKNSSLSLLYSHFSEEFPRSLPPSVIPIGGMHCTDNIKPLNEV
jgi:glucuronosyltransferase